MKILITAFDAFGNESINPSTEALQLLEPPAGTELIKMPNIPTVFGVGEQICRSIDALEPQAVLMLGQAGGRNAVTPERIAINLQDASMNDNKGFCPKDLPIDENGPDGIFSTLPVKLIAEEISSAGIPAQISNSAGTFVCNDLLYTVLYHIRKHELPVRAGFIHLPFLPGQAEAHGGFPSMSLRDMVKALQAALSVIANT